MSERSLRLAFLGCGFATRLHSRTLRRFPGVERFYASRDAGRAEAYARKYGGAGSFGSYEAALADERVDVALVATPPRSHLELALAALAAGKHVIVEKPPFLRSSDFDAVARAAEAAGRRVFVAENYYYKPMAEALRGVLSAGEIGEPRIVHVNALKAQTTGDWRDREDLAGGGALFEGGIHWVNFLANLGPRVARVHGWRPGAAEGPERTAVLVFEYEGGAVGTLFYSWEIGSPLKGLHLSAVYGTAGTATFETNGLGLFVRGRRRGIRMPNPRDLLGYGAMFEDFFHSIRTGAAPRFDLAAARRDLELVEAAYTSMEAR
ncbi:MAG TPA: Gfo/Idh/MocA family oxidoreductase [Longimicrobiaceae bacterium]|nr:Gfo/Idh/MocA family oxidoreductase [Longimicrobiaceae bacterium]